MLFQGMEASSGISMNLMPLDCFFLVWCLMERCICCWCSIRSKLVKWRACLLLLSNLASAIRSFRKASRSTCEFFFVVFKVFVRVLIFLLIVFVLLCLYGMMEDGYWLSRL